jgi:starch synthase
MQGNCVAMGNCQEFFSVHRSDYIPGVETYFIEFNKYFGRPVWRQHGIYDDCGTHQEYQDNAYRFSFFCRAALQTTKDMGFKPDVIHVHDWQTSLIPYYLKHDNDPFFYGTKSLLTLHNLPYQGRFGSDVVPYAKIEWRDFHAGAFEDYGRINLLKGGIRFADKLNTVSPNYAREILTPEYGAGLDFMLRERQNDLSGILNGIDTQMWNPQNDLIIPHRFTWDNAEQGKAMNKEALVKDTVEIPVQVNGKIRAVIVVSADLSNDEVIAVAKQNADVARYLTNEPKKVIYVPKKILNFIV